MSTKAIVLRLKPKDEVVSAIRSLVDDLHIRAGVIASMVGSLSHCCLRPAGADAIIEIPGPLEIVSATGTLGDHGMHVHIAVADKQGKTTGGHLVAGNIVLTTVELVILDLSASWIFERVVDESTGYKELLPINLDGS